MELWRTEASTEWLYNERKPNNTQPQKKLTQEAPYYCFLYEALERRLLIKLSQDKVVTESPIPIQLPIHEELQGAEATNKEFSKNEKRPNSA